MSLLYYSAAAFTVCGTTLSNGSLKRVHLLGLSGAGAVERRLKEESSEEQRLHLVHLDRYLYISPDKISFNLFGPAQWKQRSGRLLEREREPEQ